MSLATFLLAALAAPPLLAASYLLALTLASRRGAAPRARELPATRFDVVVPAHDEASGIAATVHALLAVDYPRELFRVLVIADNCSDATAAVAREAGAIVLVRDDPERRGKGFALAHAFELCELEGFADAVVVVDADTLPSANLLRAFDARLAAGAQAIQAHYGPRITAHHWRTELMRLALALFHTTRSLGRARLGLSAGLRGNGMCFARETLLRVPHRATSIVEDLEYGIELGRAGIAVAYAHEAQVWGDMPATDGAARAQRARWEHGRDALRRKLAWALLLDALRRRAAVSLDLALDLLVPPLATLALWIAVAFLASAAASLTGLDARLALAEVALAAAFLGLHVLRGWWLSGTGLRGLANLAAVPLYVIWKVGLAGRGPRARPGEWVRTPREGEGGR